MGVGIDKGATMIGIIIGVTLTTLFWEFINAEGTLRMWLRVVDKTCYRKGDL